MGALSDKIRKRLVKQKRKLYQARGPTLWALPKDVKSQQQLVREGYDPLHAAYVSAQNHVSVFAEQVSGFPELND